MPLRVDAKTAVEESKKISALSMDARRNQPGEEALDKRILRTVHSLPPMPQAVHKAREVMARPNSSFKDLAIVFVTDPAIAARVLKMANSAHYGLSKRVSSIQQASVVLGYKTLAELVTLASASKLLGETLKGYGLKSGELWQHSLAVAFGSRLIAKEKNPALSDDAFAAGLIHDAGKLVLDEYVFERKEAFQELMGEGQKSLVAAEKELLGFDHAEIASEVCQKWNMPEHLAIAIRYHHYPCRSQNDELAHILHTADALAMMSELGTGVDALSCEMDDRALEFLGLEKENLNKITSQMVASVQKTVKTLSA